MQEASPPYNDARLRAGFWEALAQRLDIQMKHTSTYNPCANGKVENSHATLYDILRSMVDRWGNNWTEHLPLAAPYTQREKFVAANTPVLPCMHPRHACVIMCEYLGSTGVPRS